MAKKYSIESHTLRYFNTSYISDMSFSLLDENNYPTEPKLFIVLNQNKIKAKDLKDRYSKLPKNILVIEVDSKEKFEGMQKSLKL